MEAVIVTIWQRRFRRTRKAEEEEKKEDVNRKESRGTELPKETE